MIGSHREVLVYYWYTGLAVLGTAASQPLVSVDQVGSFRSVLELLGAVPLRFVCLVVVARIVASVDVAGSKA